MTRGLCRATAACALAAMLAACARGPAMGPAPVVMKMNGYSELAPEPPAAWQPPPRRAARPVREARPRFQRVTVQRGESLDSLARALHVSPHAIVEANHLKPPFRLAAGTTLLVPNGATERRPRDVHEAREAPLRPLPPPAVVAASAPPRGGEPPRTVESAPLTPPSAATPALTPPRQERVQAARAEPPATRDPDPPSGRYAWPVRGRIVGGYGATAGGARNDGINIAAPRGAPVQAIDSGVVAYAGNELRGYGNLVLIKQNNGWISAYAHCQELLVKKGEKVRRGEVIARVGATGGVSEPQLHFELRRGNHAVDPREFLTPLPSAGGDLNSGDG
ncbi:MAG TPA: M23 family metallopeptidase [Stellaceae bacterium]|nr:M23 family metallopeptidase [Stellaceae bacterium]